MFPLLEINFASNLDVCIPVNERNAEVKELLKTMKLTTISQAKRLLAALMKALSCTRQVHRNIKISDATREVSKLHIPKLQKIQEEGKMFHHIFIFGVHELCQNYKDIWLQDLQVLHLGHANGNFWLFSSQDELPGNLYAELNCSFPMKGQKFEGILNLIRARYISDTGKGIN